MSKDFFTDINLSQEMALSYSLPDLLVESGTQLIQFTYNSQTQKYESQAVVNLEETPSSPSSWELVALSDSIIVGKNIDSRLNQEQTDRPQSKVIKLSPSLEKLKVYECADLAAIATDGNHIFVCTGGKLVTLNQDLETLDELDLKLEGWGWRKKKNAHDILIHQSIAYLLDNVVEPTYILRVDISHPNNLQILSTLEITGVNHHLRTQWINPDLNQWCILQYYGTQAGSGENIIILPLDVESGSVDIGQSQFPLDSTSLNERAISLLRPWFRQNSDPILGYQSISYCSFGGSEKLGFELIAVTSLPPVWGLIYERSEGLHLAKIQTSNNQVNFEQKLYLGDLKDYHYLKARITSVEELLFVLIKEYTIQHSFTRLLIIDVAQQPAIILNQDLEVQGLYNSNISCLLLPQN